MEHDTDLSSRLANALTHICERTLAELAQTRETFAVIRSGLDGRLTEVSDRVNGLEDMIVNLRTQVQTILDRRNERIAALDRKTQVIVALIGVAGVIAGIVITGAVQAIKSFMGGL